MNPKLNEQQQQKNRKFTISNQQDTLTQNNNDSNKSRYDKLQQEFLITATQISLLNQELAHKDLTPLQKRIDELLKENQKLTLTFQYKVNQVVDVIHENLELQIQDSQKRDYLNYMDQIVNYNNKLKINLMKQHCQKILINQIKKQQNINYN